MSAAYTWESSHRVVHLSVAIPYDPLCRLAPTQLYTDVPLKRNKGWEQPQRGTGRMRSIESGACISGGALALNVERKSFGETRERRKRQQGRKRGARRGRRKLRVDGERRREKKSARRQTVQILSFLSFCFLYLPIFSLCVLHFFTFFVAYFPWGRVLTKFVARFVVTFSRTEQSSYRSHNWVLRTRGYQLLGQLPERWELRWFQPSQTLLKKSTNFTKISGIFT